MMRSIPKFILAAAILLDVLLCGFTAGTILVAAGVALFQGRFAAASATPVSLSYRAAAPTYVPVPTFTPLPTYTPYPTYTPAALQPVQATPPVAEFQQLAIPTEPVSPPAEDAPITYMVQPGDTLESIAESYGVLPEQIITASGLDPNNPQINPGDSLSIPASALDIPLPEPIPSPVPPEASPYPAYPPP